MENFSTNTNSLQASDDSSQEFTTEEFTAELKERGFDVSVRTLENWRTSRNGKAPKLPAARYNDKRKAIYTGAQLDLVLSWKAKRIEDSTADNDSEEAPANDTACAVAPLDSNTAAQNDLATNGQPAENDSEIAAKAKEQQIRKTAESVLQKSAEQKPIDTRQEVAKLSGVSHDTIAKESLREENSETAQAQPSPLNLVGVDSSVPTTADKSFEDFIFESLAEKPTEMLIAETQYFMQSTVQNIIGAGLRLLEAKKRIGHGDWKQWLADNISIEYRTAVNYMAIAEKFGGENVKTFAHLSYSACVALLPLPVETAKEYIEGQEQNGTPAALKSVREIKRDVTILKQKTTADNNPTQAELPGEYFSVLNKNIDVPPDVPSPEPSAAEVIEENSSPQPTENKPLVTLNTGCEEWYTPEQYIEAARKVMGVIDLDPASSAIAQQTVKAAKYFTRADNGLQYEWAGRIWLNPPYSRGLLDKFVDKLLASTFEAAIVLTDSSTETGWFSRLATRAQMICFSTKRIKFLRPNGTQGGSPTRGSAFFYFGNSPEKFREVFQQFGWFASFIPVGTQGEAA